MHPYNRIVCFIVAVLLGVGTELLAARFAFWRYRSPLLALANIVLMFGVVDGFLLAGMVGAHRHSAIAIPLLFMTGVFVGVAYEALNEFRLRAWTWTDGPLLGIARPIDKAAAMGLAWGMAPVVAFLVSKAILYTWNLW